MKNLDRAFDDAKRFEEYLVYKISAQGYLLWAALGSCGALISFLIIVFGKVLGVKEDYLSASIGFLWLIVASTGILFAFHVRPEERSVLKPQGQKNHDGTSRKIGIGWAIAFLLGSLFEFVLSPIGLITQHGLVAVIFALALGNLWNYWVLRPEFRESLFTGLILFGMIWVVLITPAPYSMLMFGFAVALPYYMVGFYYYRVKIPSLFLRTNA